mmetsp:Transcript_27154/g.77085  ORF Transcript_27154/g.77085 Transcript_27154/m.77085 type:complete len:251 (+) Transcript_27154:649-1401(+)
MRRGALACEADVADAGLPHEEVEEAAAVLLRLPHALLRALRRQRRRAELRQGGRRRLARAHEGRGEVVAEEEVRGVLHLAEAGADRHIPRRGQQRRHGALRGRHELVVGDAVEVAAEAALALGLGVHLDHRRHKVHARRRDLDALRQPEEEEAAEGVALEAARPRRHGKVDRLVDLEDRLVVDGEVPVGPAGGPQDERRLELGVAILVLVLQDGLAVIQHPQAAFRAVVEDEAVAVQEGAAHRDAHQIPG